MHTVSPRAPFMLPCRTVIGKKVAGEIDADVEVEVRGRRATQSRSLVGQKKRDTTTSHVEPRVHVAGREPSPLSASISSAHHDQKLEC